MRCIVMIYCNDMKLYTHCCIHQYGCNTIGNIRIHFSLSTGGTGIMVIHQHKKIIPAGATTNAVGTTRIHPIGFTIKQKWQKFLKAISLCPMLVESDWHCNSHTRSSHGSSYPRFNSNTKYYSPPSRNFTSCRLLISSILLTFAPCEGITTTWCVLVKSSSPN